MASVVPSGLFQASKSPPDRREGPTIITIATLYTYWNLLEHAGCNLGGIRSAPAMLDLSWGICGIFRPLATYTSVKSE